MEAMEKVSEITTKIAELERELESEYYSQFDYKDWIDAERSVVMDYIYGERPNPLKEHGEELALEMLEAGLNDTADTRPEACAHVSRKMGNIAFWEGQAAKARELRERISCLKDRLSRLRQES